MSHVDHVWRHLPKWMGGTDPSPGGIEIIGESGWTVVMGSVEPVALDLEIIIPIPRQFSGWLLFDVEASVASTSSVGDIELSIYRVRRDDTLGLVSVDNLFTTPVVIEEAEWSSRSATVQPVLANGIYLVNEDSTPAYDFIAIYANTAGVDATGLMLNIPIGIERVAGSGVH